MQPVELVLFPGRHHVLTRFQSEVLRTVLAGGATDHEGAPVDVAGHGRVVWVVTSANHRNTRRNPVPYHRREAAIERLSVLDQLPSVVYGVPDTAVTPAFADHCIKTGVTELGLAIDPSTTVVACSTPAVARLYADLGYRIVGVEDTADPQPARPGEVLAMVATCDDAWRGIAHPATVDVFERYRLHDHVARVSDDPVVGDEGALTDTREYRTYIESFEAAADRKWAQARPHVRPGVIVDVGCATGGMLDLAASDPELAESDLYGLEVARHLFEECVHAKAQGRFANPNTFFLQANLVAGPVFPDRSVDTTLTFALTHEVFSYAGGAPVLESFARRVHEHTAPGGVWVNSDVCGPTDGDRPVRLALDDSDGANPGGAIRLEGLSSEGVHDHVAGLSTRARFDQFVQDFSALSGRAIRHHVDGDAVVCALRDAMDFMTRKDYVDNWLSECHEQFCFFDESDWHDLVRRVGFSVAPGSGAWRNEWLVEHRFAPVAALATDDGSPLDWPDTHILLVATRPT